MFGIPFSGKHNAIPRDNRNLHCVVPSLLLFPGLFHQSFLGQASTRHGSREEEIPQPRVGFPCRWNMDLHHRLHLVGLNTESLRPGVLCRENSTRYTRPAMVWWRTGYRYHCCRGDFVAYPDCAGEERDLATWRAIPAKVRHGMVRLTWGKKPMRLKLTRTCSK
jgi:hypothetical protein